MTKEIHENVKEQVNELFSKYKAQLIKNVITVNLSVLAILVTILIFVFSSVDSKLDKIITIAVNDGKQDMQIQLINSTLFRHDNEINSLEIKIQKIEAILPKQQYKQDLINEQD